MTELTSFEASAPRVGGGTPVPFTFQGDALLLVDLDGRPGIVLKPAFDAIGVDADRQIKNLRAREWARTSVTAVRDAAGRIQQMVVADVRTFLMALATIPASRVNEDARPKLVAYQSEVADAIEAYWTRGGALNPRATTDQLAILTGQAAVLGALRGVVDDGFLDAKGRILAARALGETPQLDPATKPLTVSVYLGEHGVTGAAAKSLSSVFGKRLKALYVNAHGAPPPQIEDVVGRHTTLVNQYQEQHRPLFDRVWAYLCGQGAA